MQQAQVNSYDPRQWAAAWSPAAAEGLSAARQGLARRRVLALGLGTGIFSAGAVAAFLARPRLAGPVPGADSTLAAESPEAAGTLRRAMLLSGSGELQTALQRFGLSAQMAGDVAREASPALAAQGEIRAMLEMARAGDALTFVRLQASNPDSSGAIVKLGADGKLETTRIAAQVSDRIVVMHGIMDGDSFYTSAVGIGVPNSLISPFAKALAFDFDFQREVAAGDAFELAYSQPTNASGQTMGAPELLYASLTTQIRSAAVYRFQPDKVGEVQWFDASGRTVARSLMRTPVDGARVTSKFGMRIHPIEGYQKMHGGIDFAAPIGTPIYASGSGVLEFCGPKGPNGNFIKILHDNGWETLYLHMNRFAAGMAQGVRVAQGQQIGEVGTTGHSTGPHLHYEVHIAGEKVDPLGVQPDNSASKTLTGPQLETFEQVRDSIDVSRAQRSV
ncbi:M23 family metallopeptidase [Novosphingobium sp.]|uniref:M23 family metallopeptidase n=1 Tax=Novosphingobium sp. TaxID=1874826 RepID=UPI003BABF06E